IEIPDKELQLQFQTNVFAPLALTRLAVPLMRKNGGKVVNIGSISGIVTTPFSAAYCATKAALHSLSDALRMELAPFNIQVITIQAGAVKSQFGENASKRASALLRPDSVYQAIADHIEQRARVSQEDATPADVFARKVVQQISRPQPPWLFRTAKKSFSLPLIKKLLPQRVLDRMMLKKFGLAEL
ncbi:SDR family NAD(P)-dependent oxidoreductase, partial [bacterium]|nr:SDR family NAD(P)-dependent oxidoreductase [bacterium]